MTVCIYVYVRCTQLDPKLTFLQTQVNIVHCSLVYQKMVFGIHTCCNPMRVLHSGASKFNDYLNLSI